MYQPPTAFYGFNHQSFYRQPISNLTQFNGIEWNRSNAFQQTHEVKSALHSGTPKQQFGSEYVESMERQRKSRGYSEQDTTDNQEDSVTEDLTDTYGVKGPQKHGSKTRTKLASKHRSRALSRQSSLGAVPLSQSNRAQNSKPLADSRSTGTLHDYIDRERRAHTMAPLTRILGPSSTPRAKLFASITAPKDAPTMKTTQPTQTETESKFHSKNRAAVQGNDISDSDDEEEDDDDEEGPIVVTVRYDPNTGGPPSEDTIRQAVDNQLQGEKLTKDSIVLDFLNPNRQPSAPYVPLRPKQPVFNQSILSAPRPTIRPHLQNVTSSPQRISQPSQQFLNPQQQQFLLQQKQHQQQLEHQELMQRQQRRLQQGLLLQQQKQREQQRLQQEALMQQHKEQQREQQRIQQEAILLLQKEQQQLRQELLLQQTKQKQQLQQVLQQEQQQRRKEEQLRQIQQQKQRQLQLEQQRKQEQLRLLQAQRQQQQQQQQIHQEKYQITSLPPIGPRPIQPVSSILPTTMTQSRTTFHQNKNTHPLPPLPPALVSRKNQQISSNNTQHLPGRNIYSASTGIVPSTELHTFNNYRRAYTPDVFVPVGSGPVNKQYHRTTDDTTTSNGVEQKLQRSHTAPSSSEMFRPSSAFDTPELNHENLCNMLDKIPDLRGCQFRIEYLEPLNPDGYPVPLEEDSNNDRYPEPVVTHELPNEIIQYMKNTDNQSFLSTLNSSAHPQPDIPSIGEVQTIGYNPNRQPSAIRYSGPPQYRT